jgi:hypothetical protein
MAAIAGLDGGADDAALELLSAAKRSDPLLKLMPFIVIPSPSRAHERTGASSCFIGTSPYDFSPLEMANYGPNWMHPLRTNHSKALAC